MRLCIPTASDRGLEAALPLDFAEATYLTVVDTESGEVVANREAPPRRGRGCGAREEVDAIVGLGADAVLCRSIGRGAGRWLASANLPVFATAASVVGAALEEYGAAPEHRLTVDETFGGFGRFGGGRGFGFGRGGGRGFGFAGGRGRGRER